MASSSDPTDDRLLASYEQRHRILLVGEGDFSFTEALSDQLPSGQITASALDTEAELLQKYPAEIGARLARLRARGVVLRLGVDATTVELHHLVDGADDAGPAAGPTARKKFDRVVYNFPYAHVTKFCKEFREANLHLLRGFFARSAAMLADGGEVHVRNKTSQPYCGWDLQALLPPTLEAVGDAPFDPARFPGYANKSNWGGAARAYTVGSSPNPNPNPAPDPNPNTNPHPDPNLTASPSPNPSPYPIPRWAVAAPLCLDSSRPQQGHHHGQDFNQRRKQRRDQHRSQRQNQHRSQRRSQHRSQHGRRGA